MPSWRGNAPAGRLKVCAADDFLPSLALKRIDLVKIDVEGFEKEALVGMRETLNKYRPTVVMEFSEDTAGKFGSERGILDVLPVDYQIFNIVFDRPIFLFFNRMKCCLEKFNFDKPSDNILLCPKNKTPI